MISGSLLFDYNNDNNIFVIEEKVIRNTHEKIMWHIFRDVKTSRVDDNFKNARCHVILWKLSFLGVDVFM